MTYKQNCMLKFELNLMTNWLYRFYLLWNPGILCMEFEFILGLLQTPELKAAVSAAVSQY